MRQNIGIILLSSVTDALIQEIMLLEEYIESQIHLQVIMRHSTVFTNRNHNDNNPWRTYTVSSQAHMLYTSGKTHQNCLNTVAPLQQ